MNPLIYFWLFLKASLFSSGGMGNLPSLHTDLLAHSWATERQFAESLAIGQSPGPNGLWVVSLGYLTAGWYGTLLALIAINIPPLLALIVNRVYQRIKNHSAVVGFIQGLCLATAGISSLILIRLMQSSGTNIYSILIAVVAIGLGLSRRVPLVVILLLAALVGIVTF